MDPADKMIQSIKDQQITPTRRWYFRLREGGIWGVFAVSILLGALAFSTILYAVQQTDFDLVRHFSHSMLEMFLALLPFVWIIFLVVALGLAIVSIQHSWRGYKISPLRVVMINMLFSLLLGTAFFIGGGAGWMDAAFNRTGFDYSSIQQRKQMLWSRPDEGMLAGKVLRVKENSMEMEDFDGQMWQVSLDGAFIAPVVLLEPGEIVKLVGDQTGPVAFRAQEVRPWGGPGTSQPGRGPRGNRGE